MFENITNIHYIFPLSYMVAKTMTEQQFCQKCTQKQRCQEVYHKLGNAEGPSVTKRVVYALLTPILIFIAAMTLLKITLPILTNRDSLQTAVSLLGALATTTLYVFIIKKLTQNKKTKEHEN